LSNRPLEGDDCAGLRDLEEKTMFMEGPFSGNICWSSKKATHLLHKGPAFEKSVDIMTPGKTMDQPLFDGSAEKNGGMLRPFFRFCFSKEDGQFFKNFDRGQFGHWNLIDLPILL
jgi:hypothetical protein